MLRSVVRCLLAILLVSLGTSQNLTSVSLLQNDKLDQISAKTGRFLVHVLRPEHFFNKNGRHSFPVAQMAELWITNYDSWELLSSDSLMSALRAAIVRAFRGKRLRPYIRDVKPATYVGQKVPLTKEKAGIAVYVGTQRENGFPSEITILSKGLLRHPEECKRNEIVPLDAPFRENFKIDWCQFRLSNVNRKNVEQTAMLFDKQEIRPVLDNGIVTATPPSHKLVLGSLFLSFANAAQNDDAYFFGRKRDYFWDIILVVAVPCAILLLLLLFLSLVFFGRREGQRWRDHKTPKGQLSEYVNLRRTQVRLRMLSNQRQSLDFLDGSGDQLRTTTPVGKQTVADAAACKGSSLQLYENGYGLDGNEKSKEVIFVPHNGK